MTGRYVNPEVAAARQAAIPPRHLTALEVADRLAHQTETNARIELDRPLHPDPRRCP